MGVWSLLRFLWLWWSCVGSSISVSCLGDMCESSLHVSPTLTPFIWDIHVSHSQSTLITFLRWNLLVVFMGVYLFIVHSIHVYIIYGCIYSLYSPSCISIYTCMDYIESNLAKPKHSSLSALIYYFFYLHASRSFFIFMVSKRDYSNKMLPSAEGSTQHATQTTTATVEPSSPLAVH